MPQNTTATETTTQGPKQGQQTASSQGQGAKAAKPKREKKAAAPKEPKAPREKKPKAEKPARETPAHMAKVEKIAAGLPALSGDANTLFAAMKNLATADLNGILAHLSVEIRRRGVLAATAAGTPANGPLKEGMRVQIRSGNPRFISQQGTVAKVQRIRCYVRLDGRDKDDYFFIDDVQPLTGSQGQVVTASSLAETVTRLTSNPPVIQGQGAIHALVDEEENGNESQAATG